MGRRGPRSRFRRLARSGAAVRATPAKHVLALAIGSALVVAGVLTLALTQAGQTTSPVRYVRAPPPAAKHSTHHQRAIPRPHAVQTVVRPVHRVRPAQVGVRTTTIHVFDPARTMVVAGRTVRRNFTVDVWYPASASVKAPLIVFGHGFAVTPQPYALLLRAWAEAGYVVAAPVFPLENANAPGGPNENDLPNQPGDMSLVISVLQNPQNAREAVIAARSDLGQVAVAGQSDGGDTALAAAYGPGRDTRITAAVILSGAEDPFAPRFAMPAGGPPLLAIQGTADTINPPPQTYAFFAQAAPPKYLLKLLGASHQPPYTQPGPDLTMVEHVTLAFLNRYLKGQGGALSRDATNRSAGPGSALVAVP